MLTFGSGQVNGLPLVITAIAFANRQTLHTAPVGAATPNVIKINASNLDDAAHTIHVEIESAGGAELRTIVQALPVQKGLFPVLEEGKEIILNGTCTVKVWADEADMVQVTAIVDDQADVAGVASQVIASGLVAAVQNASRFAVGTQAGTGTATEANAQIVMPRAGTLRNLRANADVAVGGGATVTVSVRVNGANTALLLTFDNADGTTAKTDTDSVAVAAGDLVTFGVVTDNVGAPAANFQAAVELV